MSDGESEQQDGDLLEADSAEKEPGDEHGEVGERGAQVGLLEHQQHGNADQREGFADVEPGELAAGQAPEVSGDGEDQDQLDPLRRLKVDAAAEVDPAPASHHLGAHQEHGDQRQQADAVGPGRDVDQAVVVDDGDEKHQHDADEQKLDLLLAEAVELGVQRRGLDLEHADDGDQQHQGEEHPVEVAERGEAAHGLASGRGSVIAGWEWRLQRVWWPLAPGRRGGDGGGRGAARRCGDGLWREAAGVAAGAGMRGFGRVHQTQIAVALALLGDEGVDDLGGEGRGGFGSPASMLRPARRRRCRDCGAAPCPRTRRWRARFLCPGWWRRRCG